MLSIQPPRCGKLTSDSAPLYAGKSEYAKQRGNCLNSATLITEIEYDERHYVDCDGAEGYIEKRNTRPYRPGRGTAPSSHWKIAPAAAVVWVAIKADRQSGRLRGGENVVGILTGIGFTDTVAVHRMTDEKPLPMIEAGEINGPCPHISRGMGGVGVITAPNSRLSITRTDFRAPSANDTHQ